MATLATGTRQACTLILSTHTYLGAASRCPQHMEKYLRAPLQFSMHSVNPGLHAGPSKA